MSDLDLTEADTRDNCDAFALLDGVPVRAMDECEVCGHHECSHYCGFHRCMRPCPCSESEPFTQREMKNTALASWDGPTRRRRG